jgi:23S rRNA (uridine2552-2'-O)-methyltransferase
LAIKDRDRVDEHYARLAKKEGYPARSVYKLKEIDDSKRILRPGHKVLDLGSSPGSWSLYASRKAGMVVGVDLVAPAVPEGPKLSFLTHDINTDPPQGLRAMAPFQVLLSDLAPKTSGQKADDSLASLGLVRAALRWAALLLEKDGTMLFKFFQGEDSQSFLKEEASPLFGRLTLHRPKAVRKRSVELYALCQGFKGVPDRKK